MIPEWTCYDCEYFEPEHMGENGECSHLEEELALTFDVRAMVTRNGHCDACKHFHASEEAIQEREYMEQDIAALQRDFPGVSPAPHIHATI